jgi:hypothetical protein
MSLVAVVRSIEWRWPMTTSRGIYAIMAMIYLIAVIWLFTTFGLVAGGWMALPLALIVWCVPTPETKQERKVRTEDGRLV